MMNIWYRWIDHDPHLRQITVEEARTLIYGMLVKVDVDHAQPLAMTHLRTRLRHAGYELVLLVQRRSPSGKGWHRWLTVEPKPESAIETVAVQLLAGSDPVREAYCLRRAKSVDGDENLNPFWRDKWNVLYAGSPHYA